MKLLNLNFTIFALMGLSIATAKADNERPFIVLTGLTQPILLKGSNIAMNYTFKNNLVIETSWGFGLDYESLLSTEEEFLYSKVKTPLSGGIGIGYMPIKNFKILWEPKFTNFDVDTRSGKNISYSVFSAGIGLYYDIYLFKGLMIQPSIKYWPKISSTLNDDKELFTDQNGATQTHEARDPGNDGVIYNVSIGWAF